MSGDWDLKILCMGAGYVGGPTMAVIAKQCPKVCVEHPARAVASRRHGVPCRNFCNRTHGAGWRDCFCRPFLT